MMMTRMKQVIPSANLVLKKLTIKVLKRQGVTISFSQEQEGVV